MKNLGKYLFITPIAIFGLLHITNAEPFAQMMPPWMPIKIVLVYITGISFIAALVAIIINKKAKLAITLLGVELLLIMILIHVLNVIGGDQMEMGQVLKDTAISGGAFYMASGLKD